MVTVGVFRSRNGSGSVSPKSAGAPMARAEEKGAVVMPEQPQLLRELRLFAEHANPRDAIFRSNHASNSLPIGGRPPRDRDALLQAIDDAIAGRIALRPDWLRGL